MKIYVLSEYQIHDGFIIGRIPVKKTYDALKQDVIHTAFQKILDEASLLKFARKYGLPSMDWEGYLQHEVMAAAGTINGFEYKHNVKDGWCRTWDPVDKVLNEAMLMRDMNFLLTNPRSVPRIGLRKSQRHDSEKLKKLKTSISRQFLADYEKSTLPKNEIENMKRVARTLTNRLAEMRVEVDWVEKKDAFQWSFTHETLMSLIWKKFALHAATGTRRSKICQVCFVIHHRQGIYCSDQCKDRRDNAARKPKSKVNQSDKP